MRKKFVCNVSQNGFIRTGYEAILTTDSIEEAEADYRNWLMDQGFHKNVEVDIEELRWRITTHEDSLYINQEMAMQDAYDLIEGEGFDIGEYEYIETEKNEGRTIFHKID